MQTTTCWLSYGLYTFGLVLVLAPPGRVASEAKQRGVQILTGVTLLVVGLIIIDAAGRWLAKHYPQPNSPYALRNGAAHVTPPHNRTPVTACPEHRSTAVGEAVPHELLTAPEAFPNLILPCPQSSPHATMRPRLVIASRAVARSSLRAVKCAFAQHAALGSGEREITGRLPAGRRSDRFGKKGDRNRAPLMGVSRADDHVTGNLAGSLHVERQKLPGAK